MDPMTIAAIGSVVVGLFKGATSATPPPRSEAIGGIASGTFDHSNWNVQIGSGVQLGGSVGWLGLAAVGALVLAAKWHKV